MQVRTHRQLPLAGSAIALWVIGSLRFGNLGAELYKYLFVFVFGFRISVFEVGY